jgi:hypothetical protein
MRCQGVAGEEGCRYSGDNLPGTFIRQSSPFPDDFPTPNHADPGCQDITLGKEVETAYGKIVKRDREGGSIR